jgi:hypothetical protein
MRFQQFVAAVVVALLASITLAAAPTTQQQSDLQQIPGETWEKDNARLKNQIASLGAKLAEAEKRKPPATRPAPATAPTSRPTSALMSENRRLVTSVNEMYGRLARAKNEVSILNGAEEVSISFACENHTIEEISDILGMTGQLMAEKEGKLTYEWLFKIQGGTDARITDLQPFVCEVVDGKIVKNQMGERRKLGSRGLPVVTPPPRLPSRR